MLNDYDFYQAMTAALRGWLILEAPSETLVGFEISYRALAYGRSSSKLQRDCRKEKDKIYRTVPCQSAQRGVRLG